MAFAKTVATFTSLHAFHAPLPAERQNTDKVPMVDGYFVDYSTPSEKAVDAVDPEMKAFIARGRVISVKGEL